MTHQIIADERDRIYEHKAARVKIAEETLASEMKDLQERCGTYKGHIWDGRMSSTRECCVCGALE